MKNLVIANIVIGVSFGLIAMIGGILFAFGVVSFAMKAFVASFFVIEILLLAIFVLLCYVIHNIKKENIKVELQKAIEQDRQLQLLSLYKRFGIEPQRKSNGELMNFYELLGIEPQFDEYGERIPTIYELLNTFPKLTKEGIEIPTVLFIKNKASKICIKPPEILKQLQTINKQGVDSKQKQNIVIPKIIAAQVKKQSSGKSSGKGGGSSSGSGKFNSAATDSSKAKFKPAEWTKMLKEMFSDPPKYKPPKPTEKPQVKVEEVKKPEPLKKVEEKQKQIIEETPSKTEDEDIDVLAMMARDNFNAEKQKGLPEENNSPYIVDERENI